MGAALWSSPPGTFRQFPMRVVIEFLENHALLDLKGRPVWRVIQGGSKQYVAELTRGFADRIRLNTAIRSVRRSSHTHAPAATSARAIAATIAPAAARHRLARRRFRHADHHARPSSSHKRASAWASIRRK